MTHRAVLVLVLALACAGSVGAGGGWEDAHAHTVETDFALPEFVKTFVGRNDVVLRALRAGDPPPRPRSKGSMVTSCDELGGIGNLSSTTDPCVIPPNTTTALTPGTWILGSGSLTVSPNASDWVRRSGLPFHGVVGRDPASDRTREDPRRVRQRHRSRRRDRRRRREHRRRRLGGSNRAKGMAKPG